MSAKRTVRCPAHKVIMIRKEIIWGMPDPRVNLEKYIIGGCCVTSEALKHHYGYVCPECETLAKKPLKIMKMKNRLNMNMWLKMGI